MHKRLEIIARRRETVERIAPPNALGRLRIDMGACRLERLALFLLSNSVA
jgi:hypothetical protein